MALNINDLSKPAIKQKLVQNNDVQPKPTQADTSQQAKKTGLDSVSITPQAQQLGELQKKASDAPVVNQRKIRQLQEAIASGNYKINPDKLAASISNFEFKLD